MPTALFVQEFGANLGHIIRLVAVAGALPRQTRKVFVVPDPKLAEPLVRAALGFDAALVATPRFGPFGAPVTPAWPELTLADVFHNCGYGDALALNRAADQWVSLIASTAPSLIVSDFAPTVRLANWDKVPVVQIGDGYATPPPLAVLPPLRDVHAPLPAASRTVEQGLLRVARAVRARLGGPALTSFSALFQGDETFVSTVPTLDPYDGLRRLPTVFPFGVDAIACGPPFAERTGPAIFCFLWSSHPDLNRIVTALNGIDRPSQLHVRGVDPQVVARNCAPQVSVYTASADFRTVLPQTRLFIHYGGMSASVAGLLAGVVQMTFPKDFEKEVTARKLQATGASTGLALAPDADVGLLRRMIEDHLANGVMEAAALASGTFHQRTRTADPMPAIGQACLALINRPTRARGA